MIAHLGELLRVMLETASHEVALAEELALTETYLAIEHARLDARLLRHAGGAGVVLSRQPLADNAIRHGIRVDALEWLPTEGDHVVLHAAGTAHLLREP